MNTVKGQQVEMNITHKGLEGTYIYNGILSFNTLWCALDHFQSLSRCIESQREG